MRALLMVCLAAVLCVDVANSLKCYTCANQTSNEQCQTSSACNKNEAGCLTLVESGTHQQKLINKKCILNCKTVQTYHECCNTDDCNRSEASGMRPPIVVLGTAVLVSVTRSLLWTGL